MKPCKIRSFPQFFFFFFFFIKYLIHKHQNTEHLRLRKMNVQDITFPEEASIVTKTRQPKVEIPPSLRFITSLLYKSGAGLSLLFFLSIVIVQPLLEVQYERRSELVCFVLQRARKLLVTMTQRRNLPVVAVKRGEELYSDALTQTDDPKEEEKQKTEELRNTITYGVTFQDQVDENGESVNLVSKELKLLKESLEHYNESCCSIDGIHPFTFQVKKFQGNIDAYRHASLFKTGKRMAGSSSSADIKNEIRTIKGWYLTGQV